MFCLKFVVDFTFIICVMTFLVVHSVVGEAQTDAKTKSLGEMAINC